MNTVLATRSSTDLSVLASEATEIVLEGMRSRWSNSGTNPNYRKRREEDIVAVLPTYSETTLRKIISFRNSSDIGEHCYIIEGLIGFDDEHGEEYISNYLHLAHCFPITDDGSRTAAVTLALASLDYYDGLTEIGPNYEYPQLRIDQCTAIFALVSHFEKAFNDGVIDESPLGYKLFDNDMKYGHLSYVVEQTSDETIFFLEDPNFCGLITAPDTDLDALVSIVAERSIFEIETLLELLEMCKVNRAAAISSGTL